VKGSLIGLDCAKSGNQETEQSDGFDDCGNSHNALRTNRVSEEHYGEATEGRKQCGVFLFSPTLPVDHRRIPSTLTESERILA
jgi:hypothetical protein